MTAAWQNQSCMPGTRWAVIAAQQTSADSGQVTAMGRIRPVSEVSRGEQHPLCRATSCLPFHKKSADVAIGAWKLRCITMYIYIATTCRENSILTKHHAHSPTSYVCSGYESFGSGFFAHTGSRCRVKIKNDQRACGRFPSSGACAGARSWG